MEQVRIAVTGMHRSGTSMFAHFLNQSGIHLGDRLYVNQADNPYGHFEDEDFIDLHMLETKRHGVDFEYLVKEPIAPGQNWKRKAQQLYKEKLERNKDRKIWGWKEPRTALFLNHWEAIDPNLHFLFIFRDPTAVVSSLCRRHGKFYSPYFVSLFYEVYIHYNQQIAKYLQQNTNFTLLSYESLVTRSRDALQTLKEDLNHPFTVEVFEQVFDKNIRQKKRKVWPILGVPQRKKAEELYSLLKMQQSF